MNAEEETSGFASRSAKINASEAASRGGGTSPPVAMK